MALYTHKLFNETTRVNNHYQRVNSTNDLLDQMWLDMYPNEDERVQRKRAVQLDVRYTSGYSYGSRPTEIVGFDMKSRAYFADSKTPTRAKLFGATSSVETSQLREKIEELYVLTVAQEKKSAEKREAAAQQSDIAKSVRAHAEESGLFVSYSSPYTRHNDKPSLCVSESKTPGSVTVETSGLGIDDLDAIMAYLRNGGLVRVKSTMSKNSAIMLIDSLA